MVVRQAVAFFTSHFSSIRPSIYIHFLIYCFLLSGIIIASTTGALGADFIDSVSASIFELQNNPAAYDGSITLIKVSVIGNLTNINSHPMYLSDNEKRIKVYGHKTLLYGFNESTQIKITGTFMDNAIKENEIEVEFAEYYPKVDAGIATVEEINAHPTQYNGKYVKIYGDVLRIHEFFGLGYVIHIGNNSTNAYVKTRFFGTTDLNISESASAEGLFNSDTLYATKVEKYRENRDLYSSIKYAFFFLCTMAIIATTIWYVASRKRKQKRHVYQ